MTALIYTAYHRPAPRVASRSVIPIHVGRARASAPLPGLIGDDTGENISRYNDSYCELTALYWAWKNAPAEADRIGLMHYRRLLDCPNDHVGATVEITPRRLHLPDWCARLDAWLDGPGREVDIVLPRPHLMGRTLSRNYGYRHHIEDYGVARDLVARDHPEMLPTFDRVSQGRALRLGNIFLMRRELVDAYCGWLFPILESVANSAGDRPASPDQSRYIGFLAERLFTIYAAYLMETRPELVVREVSILNLAGTLVTPYIGDDSLNGPEHINIAFAADRTYLPHAAAMIQSVLARANRGRQINLFFLHSSVSDLGRAMLAEVVAEAHPNAHLHEIDTGGAFETAHRSESRSPSNATYSRFLLFSLLPRLNRLLYLDCDVIARVDVGALFDADLQGAEIGGVPDWIMTRTLTGKTPTVDPAVPDLGIYQREVLGLSEEDIAGYLNAGVMVFDFAAMADVAQTGAKLTEMAETGRYLFRDQDILNSHFRGRTAQLDPRWNVFNSSPVSYQRVPKPGHDTALAAKRDPWIIHYADSDWKPWTGAAVPLAQHYWQSLIQTPFYGEVMGALKVGGDHARHPSIMRRVARTGQRMADRFPVLRGPFLRIHAALGHPGRR